MRAPLARLTRTLLVACILAALAAPVSIAIGTDTGGTCLFFRRDVYSCERPRDNLGQVPPLTYLPR